jgi:hypothetical protein
MRALAIAAVILCLFASVAPALEIFEKVAGPVRGYDPSWPPDGDSWHQIQPADQYCTFKPQTAHDDQNGNGIIDPCENVQIGGVWKHVEWVGPTIAISKVGGTDMLLIEPVPGRQNEYHIVYPPEFQCLIVPITGAVVQECEIVTVESGPNAGEWHIDEINTNIHTNGSSPTERSTWARIKSFFSGFFR